MSWTSAFFLDYIFCYVIWCNPSVDYFQLCKLHVNVIIPCNSFRKSHQPLSPAECLKISSACVLVCHVWTYFIDSKILSFILQEIVTALAGKKNIVPVTDNFMWPDPMSLPEDMRAILNFNGIKWVAVYSENSNKLKLWCGKPHGYWFA